MEIRNISITLQSSVSVLPICLISTQNHWPQATVYISFACYRYFVWFHSLRIVYIYQCCLLRVVLFLCPKKSLPTSRERIHSPMWMENKPQCDWSNQNYANVSLETTMGSEARGVGPSWRLGFEEVQGAKAINISPVATAAASSVKLSKDPCGALCARHGWESWGPEWESGEHRGKCLEFRQLWGWWFCQRMDTQRTSLTSWPREL